MKTCIDCEQKLSLSLFSRSGKKRRPECKACEKVRRERRRDQDAYLHRLNTMAHGIRSRTEWMARTEKNQSYLDRGIENRLGGRIADIREFLDANFSEEIKEVMKRGSVPTVDRIDPYSHYEIDNIRIIPQEENVSETGRRVTVTYPDGRMEEYLSVKSAATSLGCKRDTIYHGAKNPGTNRKGLEFVIHGR